MTDMAHTIEQTAGDTILQQTDKVRVGGKTYRIAPPSIATLVLVSQHISRLPRVSLNDGDIVSESLSIASDCKAIGDIIATLIIGAKRRFRVLFHYRRRRLARRLMHQCTPTELHALTVRLLKTMQIGDFFALTTFLLEINLLRPTKVENETTASGQS